VIAFSGFSLLEFLGVLGFLEVLASDLMFGVWGFGLPFRFLDFKLSIFVFRVWSLGVGVHYFVFRVPGFIFRVP